MKWFFLFISVPANFLRVLVYIFGGQIAHEHQVVDVFEFIEIVGYFEQENGVRGVVAVLLLLFLFESQGSRVGKLGGIQGQGAQAADHVPGHLVLVERFDEFGVVDVDVVVQFDLLDKLLLRPQDKGVGVDQGEGAEDHQSKGDHHL